ncbi:hypothetical protein GH810_13645 [Acetobacterium paludosum]|uniref:MBG domain-containing protein n=1 Tax=Acetobacterium paludosum TaxID=52693 RepID=A0A923KQP6_9FIRM|nr:MBG domain-containing protein [Acetobacterium paludosum]MBC3889354.1 hypothetical protein [Acetobacterium paludosum]
MKKTKICWRFLSLVLAVILIATCFPMGIFAEGLSGNDFWFTSNDSETTVATIDDSMIVQGTLTPMITFSEDVFYNGSPQNLAAIKPTVDGPEVDPALVEITYTGTKVNGEDYLESIIPPTDAGTYSVTAKYAGDDNYRSDSETKEIKIKCIELNLMDFFTEKPITKIYDGTLDVPENAIVGLKNRKVIKDDENNVIFNFKSASFLSKDVMPAEPNTVTVKNVTITGSKGQNYIIVENTNENKETDQEKKVAKDAKLNISDVVLSASITPKPVEVFLTGQDKVYDGTANLNECEFNINSEDVIAGEEIEIFTTDDFSPWYGEENSQQKDVGEYYVWASGGYYFYGINGTNGNNYTIKNDPISSKEKYCITPAPITVVPSYRSKVEGDQDPFLTYTVWRDHSGDTLAEGLFGGDTLYGSLEREAGEAVGKYDVYLGSLSNSNYYISFVQGEDKFEILKKDEAAAAVYSGDYYNPSTGTGEDEKEPPVAYFGIALALLLLIVGGIFFGKNRLTKM